jgi:hypothetical protein
VPSAKKTPSYNKQNDGPGTEPPTSI